MTDPRIEPLALAAQKAAAEITAFSLPYYRSAAPEFLAFADALEAHYSTAPQPSIADIQPGKAYWLDEPSPQPVPDMSRADAIIKRKIVLGFIYIVFGKRLVQVYLERFGSRPGHAPE